MFEFTKSWLVTTGQIQPEEVTVCVVGPWEASLS